MAKCYITVSLLSFLVSLSAEYVAAQSHLKPTTQSQAVVRLTATLGTGGVETFAFSPVSKLVALGHKDHTVQFWDATSGKWQRTLTGFKGTPAMYWSPDGQRILVTGGGQTASVWEARTGEKLCDLSGSRRDIRAAQWSPDGKTIMLITQDDSLKADWLGRVKTEAHLWDARTGRLKFSLRIKGPAADATFSPDGQSILTTGTEEGARLWDGAGSGHLKAALFPTRGSSREGAAGEFSPDGRFIALNHAGRGLYLWDAATGELRLKVVEQEFGKNVYSLRGFSPDGRLLVIYREHLHGWGRIESAIELRDVATGTLSVTLTGRNMRESARQVVWAPDGRTLVTAGGSREYEGKIWDVATGRLRATFPMVAKVRAVPFSNGYGEIDYLLFHPTLPILMAVNHNFMRFWNLTNGELLQQAEDAGLPAQWSADGRLLVTLAKDWQSVHSWELVYELTE